MPPRSETFFIACSLQSGIGVILDLRELHASIRRTSSASSSGFRASFSASMTGADLRLRLGGSGFRAVQTKLNWAHDRDVLLRAVNNFNQNVFD